MKKLLSLLLTVCTVIGSFTFAPLTAFADSNGGVSSASATVSWSEPDTSWYNETDTEFVLMDAADFAGFAKLVNEGVTFAVTENAKKAPKDGGKHDRVTIKLGADIVFYTGNASTWGKNAPGENCPMVGDPSNSETYFNGIFDGQGHTISGYYVDNGMSKDAALFIRSYGSDIKNFSLVNSYVAGRNVAGVCLRWGHISYYFRSKVTNVYVDANLVCKGGTDSFGGGVIGKSIEKGLVCNSSTWEGEMDIVGCVFAGLLSAPNGCQTLGGMIGQNFGALYVADCLYAGDIYVDQDAGYVGGLVGLHNSLYDNNKLNMKTNVSVGNIDVKSTKAYVSQIATLYILRDLPKANHDAYVVDNGLELFASPKTLPDSDVLKATVVDLDALMGLDIDEKITKKLKKWTPKALDILVPAAVAEMLEDKQICCPSLLVKGAAVKFDEVSGLRFTAKVSKAELDALGGVGKKVTYGIIIARTADVNAAGEFTVDALTGKDYIITNSEDQNFDGEFLGLTYKFRAAVEGLDDVAELTTDYSARAYVKVVEGTTETYFYSAYNEEDNARNVLEVAQAASADLKDASTEDYTIAITGGKFSYYTEDQKSKLDALIAKIA